MVWSRRLIVYSFYPEKYIEFMEALLKGQVSDSHLLLHSTLSCVY